MGPIEFFNPRAFENLKRFLEELGVGVFLWRKRSPRGGNGSPSFSLWCVPGKAAGDVLGEVLLGVGQEVDRAFAMSQYAFGGIGGVAAFEHHRVVLLSGDVIREDERIGAKALRVLLSFSVPMRASGIERRRTDRNCP